MRLIDGNPLGDPATHRMAVHVSGLYAGSLKDRDRVGCKEPRCVPVGIALAAGTDPSMFEADHAEMLRQSFCGRPPTRPLLWPDRQ
ncbi:hypothetical protein NicSoilB4_16130 [Arthrobacter sp. NicSoilB4]|nr:hypothetical protein NicSoilB4_16130 [Arthrobacter sp. NicSoilB4]